MNREQLQTQIFHYGKALNDFSLICFKASTDPKIPIEKLQLLFEISKKLDEVFHEAIPKLENLNRTEIERN